MTARTAARLSLSVKYQCPDAACVKLEISPRTHSAGMLRSNNCPTAWFDWATVRISRANALFVTGSSIVMGLSDANLSTGQAERAAMIPRPQEFAATAQKR